MDTRAEHAVLTTLRALSAPTHDRGPERITVLVTHRLANIRDVDHIIVLDRGRIVEHGTPRAADQLRRDLRATIHPASHRLPTLSHSRNSVGVDRGSVGRTKGGVPVRRTRASDNDDVTAGRTHG
jgi:ABC-type multidrug transport system ATPase subunit